MIILKLVGGLGNQLFQYATGRKISLQSKQQLLFDLTDFGFEYSTWKYVLGNFPVCGKPISKSWQQKLITPGTRLYSISRKLGLIEEKVEKQFTLQEGYNHVKKPVTYYAGFWQSYKYFEDIRLQLLQEITLESVRLTEVKDKLAIPSSSVCIHVRRKDYLTLPRYGFLGEAYYKAAIEHIKQHVSDPHFYIFSDDIEWCKQNFNIANATYVTNEFGLKDYEELLLMSCFSNHIVANSSFSWWGAWLCKNPQQIVIRPTRPFNDPTLFYEHCYPETWIAISNEDSSSQ